MSVSDHSIRRFDVKFSGIAVAAIDDVRNNPVVATATLMFMIDVTPRSAFYRCRDSRKLCIKTSKL